MSLIELKNINKCYSNGDKEISILENFNLTVNEGEMVAICGKSGCGKTTLLNILAGIDGFDSGEYIFDGEQINIKKSSAGVKFRKNRVSVVVQHFALINDYSVFENVELALWESKMSKSERKAEVEKALINLGIADLKDKFPAELSGGEKQRTAIGRAIVNNPKLILADEPTGSLDSETEKKIISMLCEINRKQRTTMIIVTHDSEVAECCSRIVTLNKL